MSRLSIDPITIEVVQNALSSIADELALVIMRAAYSNIVRDSMDYSTAVCDFDGRTIAQGLTNPVHLGSFPHAMKSLISQQKGKMNKGGMAAKKKMAMNKGGSTMKKKGYSKGGTPKKKMTRRSA